MATGSHTDLEQPEQPVRVELPREDLAQQFDEHALAQTPSIWRYLPIAIAASALVVVTPALLAALVIPRGGVLETIGAAALAMSGSLLLASVGAALWKRQRRSRDVVFAELMLWGWARRWLTERRVSRARELIEVASATGERVKLERLIGLSRTLQSRDAYLHGHGRRVAHHAARIARAMGLSPAEVTKIRAAAEVHDVGKLYTPRAILNNPQALSDGEFAVVRLHAGDGARMAGAAGDAEITAIVRHHHERIDGGGYPDGLGGSGIPLGARIVAVADTFDALTSDRAYRRAHSQKEALDVLAAEAGTQLDASAVAAFRQVYVARRPVAWTALGSTALQRVFDALGSATSSFGGGVTALGAAGVLAVSPGIFRDSRAPSPVGAGDTAGVTALVLPATDTTAGAPKVAGTDRPAAAGTPGTHTLRPRDGHGTTPRFRPASGGGGSTTPGGGGSAATGPASSGAGPTNAGLSSSSVSSTPGSTTPNSAVTPQLPAPNIPSPPTLSTPSATTPSVGTPAVSTPSVSTPTVSTPGVSTPSVPVGPVTVPSVTVPSVTVPSVTVPSLGGGH